MRRHAAASQAQRARRLLCQEAVRRSHRRGEFIRLMLENEPAPPLSPVESAEPADERPAPV